MGRTRGKDKSVPITVTALDLATLPLVRPDKAIRKLDPLDVPPQPSRSAKDSSYVYAYVSLEKSSIQGIPEGESQELGLRPVPSTASDGPVYLEFAVEIACKPSATTDPRKRGHRRTQSCPPEYDLILRPSGPLTGKPSHRRTLSDPAAVLEQAALEAALTTPEISGHVTPTRAEVQDARPRETKARHRRTASEPPSAADLESVLSEGTAAKKASKPGYCFNCKNQGHISKNCPNPCSFCKKLGHWSGSCPDIPKGSLPSAKSAMLQADPSDVLCFNCKQKGHRSAHCTAPCAYCGGTDHWSRTCPRNPKFSKGK
mmetsp:Transcript_57522/g.135352  ORF Transcript_57522/g.135352 Transcript_57522/m.135352 type:complete len:315 (+) Transcript_57522:3-947(+)